MASGMRHFPKVSYVSGGIHVELTLDRLSEQFEKAQWWLGEQVLQSCRAHMPLSTGSLQQRSSTTHMVDNSSVLEDGRKVIFPGPYARFQYMGKVMIGEESHSPWARKGEHKVVTDRPLTYSRPEATSRWFDTAKEQDGEAWINGVKEILGGK